MVLEVAPEEAEVLKVELADRVAVEASGVLVRLLDGRVEAEEGEDAQDVIAVDDTVAAWCRAREP